MKITRISLIIATYCRPVMLRDTVLSLSRMALPEEVAVEVIVIDNDPAGSALAVNEELQGFQRERFSIRYVHEQKKGLSFARNRGIEEAQGEVLAFLDDDLFVTHGWLQSMLECLERTGADVVGGRTVIYWEGEPEELIRRCHEDTGTLDMGEQDQLVRGKTLPGGGNAAFRKEVFAGGLRFSGDLGRIGKVLLSGEDSEMFQRLRMQGKTIWYCAGAMVHHRTGGERLKVAYHLRQNYWFGISFAIIDRRLYGRRYQLAQALGRMTKAVFLDSPRWLLAALRGDPVRTLHARWSLARQVGYVQAAFSLVRISHLASQSASTSV